MLRVSMTSRTFYQRKILTCFSGAIEKQKLVYTMNRDAAGRLTISSPLEAHKGNAIVYSIVGLDVGTENPTFAVLEVDHSEADQVGVGGGGE